MEISVSEAYVLYRTLTEDVQTRTTQQGELLERIIQFLKDNGYEHKL